MSTTNEIFEETFQLWENVMKAIDDIEKIRDYYISIGVDTKNAVHDHRSIIFLAAQRLVFAKEAYEKLS